MPNSHFSGPAVPGVTFPQLPLAAFVALIFVYSLMLLLFLKLLRRISELRCTPVKGGCCSVWSEMAAWFEIMLVTTSWVVRSRWRTWCKSAVLIVTKVRQNRLMTCRPTPWTKLRQYVCCLSLFSDVSLLVVKTCFRTSYVTSSNKSAESWLWCLICIVFQQLSQGLSVANQNLVTVRMKPDESGRFGFNVKVWSLCKHL